ncbi:hypothetical protein ACLOJK_024044, partial [Asimina triloba]
MSVFLFETNRPRVLKRQTPLRPAHQVLAPLPGRRIKDSSVQQMTYYNQDPTGNFYPYTYNYEGSYLPNHYGTDQQNQSQNFHQQMSYFEQEPT